MLNQIIDTEMGYLKCFCQTESDNEVTHFTDKQLKDMYSHNFTYISENVSDRDFIKALSRTLEYQKSIGCDAYKIMTHKELSSDLISMMPTKPVVERYDYYGTYTKNYDQIRTRQGASVLLANNSLTEEHGKYIDVAANYMDMTMEFAIRRINRKFKVYLNERLPLNLYICYDQKEPVGNCEAFINDSLMKIEDFDILEMHQKKGYGSHMLRNMLEMGLAKQVDFAYVVTDHDDTAKHMYEKCGFDFIGYRTELIFKLE